MSKREARITNLLQLAKQRGGVSIKTLSQELGVSEMTVRRDVQALQAGGMVETIQGVVLYRTSTRLGEDQDYFLLQQKSIREHDKERIARHAAKMVQAGDSIFVDIGTTTAQLLRYLPQGYPITVICSTVNSLNEALKKNFENLIFCGGYYHRGTQMFESPESCDFLRKVRASKAFVSAAGLSQTLELTCVNHYEVMMKQACIGAAQTKILLMDSGKMGQVKAGYVASLQAMDSLITDTELPLSWQQLFQQEGIPFTMV